MGRKQFAWGIAALTLAAAVGIARAGAPGRDSHRGAAYDSGAAIAPADPAKAASAATTQAARDPVEDIDYSVEAYRVVSTPDTVCTVLRNGLTIIAKRIPSPVVSVQGLCHTGSIYEGKWLGGGLSHLLEHLLAGGTNARRSEQANRDLLQSIGDNSNAFTSYDTTVFFVNTTNDHASEAVDLVTGWLFESTIPVLEYRREYEVVQRELEKDNGEADWAFYQLAQLNRYQVHPARMPVVGYQDVIRSLSRDEVYEYYKLAYVPQNIVFAVAGNIDPEAAVAAVRKYAGHVRPGRVPQKVLPEEPTPLDPRAAVATFPKLGNVRLELAFPSIRQTHPDLYALDTLAAILGQGESSILVQELRDKAHLVNSVSCGDNTPLYVDGTLAIDMEVPPEKIKAVTEATLAIAERVKQEGVSEERLARAKAMLKAADAYGRQSSENVAQSLVFSYLNTGLPFDTYQEGIAKVTAAQVKDVAGRYLLKSRLLTTALLPAEWSPGAPKPDAPKEAAAPTAPPAERTDAQQLRSAVELIRAAAPTTRQAAVVEASETVTRVELANGTVLLLKRVATSPVVSVQMYAAGGLSVEDAATNGLGNLTMELLPRGTKRHTADEIATFWDSIGGVVGTTCGNNSWNWSATALSEHFPEALAHFADMVNEPSFPDDETGAMKERIAAAIDAQDSDWMGGGKRYFLKTFFGPSGSPYQFTVSGTKPALEKLTAEACRKFYAEKVLPARRVLAIYGDIDVAATRDLAAKYLGGGPKLSGPKAQLPPPSAGAPAAGAAAVKVEQVEVQKWDNPEAAVFIGFRSDSLIGDSDDATLTMADTLTSGYTYPTGYIFETLRGKGLVYDANAVNLWGVSPKTPGTFWAYAACDPKNVDACVDDILLNIARLQGTDADLDMDWFARSKSLVASVDAMENETASSQAQTAAIDELFGRGYDYHGSFPKRINAVTAAQLHDLARRRLRDAVVVVSTNKPELVKTSKAGERRYETFPAVELAPQGVQHDTGGK